MYTIKSWSGNLSDPIELIACAKNEPDARLIAENYCSDKVFYREGWCRIYLDETIIPVFAAVRGGWLWSKIVEIKSPRFWHTKGELIQALEIWARWRRIQYE